MGWRGTTTNLNLNRDYMKADTPETRAWLKIWDGLKFRPPVFSICHVTDGADFRYNVTYHLRAPAVLRLPVLPDWIKERV